VPGAAAGGRGVDGRDYLPALTLATLLEAELTRRKLPYRKAAREIGIAHTTLIAAARGNRTLDTRTTLAICRWLGLPIDAALPAATDLDESLYAAVYLVVKSSPALVEIFQQAARDIQTGNLQPADFDELVHYAAYLVHRRSQE
jgi:transcriptional regulator with XRE-family HTH domain